MYCKACGGDLHRVGNYNICKFCGNKWIIDASDDVHVVDRANAWAALRENDFEKATELFENILIKEPDNHEAYWGIALSVHGIIYVTDMNEHKKVPTCNNISEYSFVNDKQVQKAISLAPADISAVYKKQAEEIEKIRLEWLKKARKEPPYDIFISFKDSDREHDIERTQDSIDAQDLYNALVEAGYKVFFSRVSLRDKISEQYEPYIYNAIKTAKVMIVFGEKAEYFNAVWIKNEWSRFKTRIEKGEKHKNSLVVAYKNMDPGDLPIVLKSRQCMNAADITFLSDLTRHIARVIEESKQAAHLDRIAIKGGQMSKKASKIANSSIQTREIGGGNSVETSVSDNAALEVIKSYIKAKQWKDAKNRIDQFLLNSPNSAEALLLNLIVARRVNNIEELFRFISTTSFSPEDKAKIEQILNCASKAYAGELLDFIYKTESYMSENIYMTILKTILPYNYDGRKDRIAEVFLSAIANSKYDIFELLLSTLQSDEVDSFIDYCLLYAEQTSNTEHRMACVNRVLEVDSGNVAALRMRFDHQWSTSTAASLSKTFEEILKYCPDINAEILSVLNKICNDTLTAEFSEFSKQVLKYYVGDLKNLTEILLKLGFMMIQAEMFEDGQYIMNLILTVDPEQAQAYWGLCLVRVHASSEEGIIESNILLEQQPEYNKYLTLVDEDRRQACIRLTKRQEHRRNHKKRVKRTIIALSATFVALVVAAIVATQWILPKVLISKANELIASDKYKEAMLIYTLVGDMSWDKNQDAVIDGIKEINKANFDKGIEALLKAKVPVKITYIMDGGEFSGGSHISNPFNADGVLLGTSGNSGIVPLSTSAAPVETVEMIYKSSGDFKGLQIPARTGYRFVEWTIDIYRYEVDGYFEIKLRAIWSANTYNISYDLDGGSVSGNNPVKYGIDDVITLVNPTKKGYTFVGWTGTDLTAPTMTVTIEKGVAGDRSYKANWVANTYKLTFNANGGVVAEDSITVTYDQNYIVPTPTREGYTFHGWKYQGISYNGGVWTVDSDVTVVADWVSYELTTTTNNTNGGTFTEKNNTLTTEGDTVIITATTNEGYTFIGWYQGSTLVSSEPSFEFKMPGKNVTLTARWDANTYSITYQDIEKLKNTIDVTFNYNYTDSTSTTVVLRNDQVLDYPEIPVRDGYAFTGWYTDAECTELYSFSGTITEDMTLYAGWDNYEVANDWGYPWSVVDGVLVSTNKDHSSSSTYSITATMPVTISFSYKTSSESSCDVLRIYVNGYEYSSCSGVTEYEFYSVNLEAGDTLSFTYSKDGSVSNGNDCAYIADLSYITNVYYDSTAIARCDMSDGYQYGDGETISVDVEFGTNHTLPTPIRTGYTFLGWYNGETLVESGAWNIASDVTLTPMWQAGGNIITLDANGGTLSSGFVSVTYGEEFTLPEPEKTGYTFVGWYADDVQYTSGTWAELSDVTLVASWTVSSYDVTLGDTKETIGSIDIAFDHNYIDATITTVTLTNGQTLDYPEIPTRNGYVFTGWYTDSDCTELYSFGGEIVEDMTLYAGWIEQYENAYSNYTVNPIFYTSDNVYSIYNSGTSSSYQKYLYVVANESGEHRIYLANSSSSYSYGTYIGITNLTTGEIIQDTYYFYDTYYSGVVFDCNAGDVIVINLYMYNYSSYAYFYFEGFGSITSDATVSCDDEDGYVYEEDTTASITVTYGEDFTLPVPEREGYTFLGWYNGETLVESGVWYVASDVTLTPMWQAGGNTITLDANGGTVSSSSVAVKYDEAFTLPEPKRDGYTFNGWFADGVQYTSGTWTELEDITLVASWTAKSYNVSFEDTKEYIGHIDITFDYNYIDSTPMTVTLTNGQILDYPQIPTRYGYVFNGWYTDADCTERYSFGGEITEDMTLYAGWVEQYTNAYSSCILDPTVYNSSSSEYGIYNGGASSTYQTYVYVVANESGTHYIYYRNGSSSSSYRTYIGITNMTTGETIMYTDYCYSTYYSGVSFECNAGDVIVINLYYYSYSTYAYFYFEGFDSITSEAAVSCDDEDGYAYEEDTTFSTTVTYDQELTLPTPVRRGYSFLGWYYNGELFESGTWNLLSDITLTPMWQVGGNTIVLDANGGECDDEYISVTYDEAFTLPEPERTGYTFNGWFADGVQYTSGTWTELEDITLVASWTVNTYDVTFEDTRESIGSVDITFDYNYATIMTVTLTNGQTLDYPEIPTRYGYVFTGWYTDADCTELYSFGGEIVEDMTLYAGWVEQYSNAYSNTVLDPTLYNPDNVYYISNGGTSSSYQKYLYLVANESGTHYIYYKNGSSSSSYRTYIGITNMTTGETIMYTDYYYNTYYTGVSFECNAGDVIVINLYYYSYSEYVYFYFEGFGSITSDATVSCDNADGYVYEEGTTNSITITYGDEFMLPTPEREGYTFLGWYYNGELFESGTWNLLSDVTLTPMWQAIENTITLDANGGECDDEYISVTYDGEFTLPEPERTGYTFNGWFADGVQYTSGTWTELEDITLVASWTVNTYDVTFEDTKEYIDHIDITFDYNYIDSTPTTVTLTNGQTLDYPEIPTREGYVFAGWYIDADCTELYGFSGEIVEDMTLYAGWSAYVITNDSSYPWVVENGVLVSTNKSHSSSSTYTITATAPITITFSYKTSSESGCDNLIIRLNGSTIQSCSGENEYVECTVTLSAGDYLTFTYSKDGSVSSGQDCAYVDNLSFISNVSCVSTAVASCDGADRYVYEEDATASITITYGDEFMLPTPERAGYTFLGWYYNGELFESGTWNLLSDITLTPMWQVNEYTITLDANGGECDDEYISVTYDEEFTLPVLERTGYTFNGWFADGVQYTSGTWTELSDVTLVASWTITPYNISLGDTNKGKDSVSVTFDYNYADTTPTTVTLTNGEILSQPVLPTREGFVFSGWYTDADCTSIYSFSGDIAEDMTLYAGWIEQYGNAYNSYILDPTLYNSSYEYSVYTGGTSSSYQTYLYLVANESGTHYIYYRNGSSSSSYRTYIGITNMTTDETIKYTDYYYNTYYSGVSFECNAGDVIVINLYYYSYSTYAYFYFEGFGSLTSDATVKCYDQGSYVYEEDATSSITITYGEELMLPTPEREGYTFLGWYYNGELFESGTWTLLFDIALTPVWQANQYTVTLDANGGEVSSDSVCVTYDSAYTLPTPVRTGYTFDGWYIGDVQYTADVWSIPEDTVLVAKWTAKTDISYVVNHYLQNANDDGYTKESSETLIGTADEVIVPDVNTYDYFVSPSAKTVTVAPDGSLVVDYYYDRITYELTYVTNGGDVIEAQTYKYGQTLDVCEPNRSGYTFGGWFVDADLSEEYSATETLNEDTTIYAYWTEENKPSDFTYSGEESITISGYNGDSTTLWIPAYIGGAPVEIISSYAFENQMELIEVIVPDTVVEIGEGAFKGCESLEEMTLPFVGKSATSSGTRESVFGYIFGRYTYSTYTAPAGATYQGWGKYSDSYLITGTSGYNYGYSSYYYADYYYIPASLTSVTITSDTTIPYGAFQNCVFIENVVIPENTTEIGAFAFAGCISLDTINSTTSGEISLPTNVAVISAYAFKGCIEITDVVFGDVTTIEKYAFAGCENLSKLNSDTEGELIIPEGVTTIGSYAFQDLASITKIVVSDTVTEIGEGAFKGCEALEDITLPFVGKSATSNETNESVFGYIFGRYATGATTTPVGTIYQGWGKSSDSYLITGTSGYNKYTHSSYYADYYYIPTSIRKVTITADTTIPYGAFQNCDFIEEIVLSDDTVEINAFAFKNCKGLTEMDLGSSLETIGQYAFDGCISLESITVPDTLTSLGSYAFNGCVALKYMNSTTEGELSLPAGLTEIPEYAFQNCQEITVVVLGDITTIGSYAFAGCESITMFNSETEGELIIPEGVTTIGSYAFQGLSSITNIVVPDTVTEIGVGAFKGCEALEEITLPFIGKSATSSTSYEAVFGHIFGRYTSSTSSKPQGTTYQSWGKYSDTYLVTGTSGYNYSYSTYYYADYYYIPTSIRKVTITADTTIPYGAFHNCDFIEEIVISDATEEIGALAFKNCQGIVEMDLGSSLETIGQYAFDGCISLESITVPDTLTSLGSYAFNGCVALKQMNSTTEGEISLPISLTEVPEYAFQNCKEITVVVLGDITTIGSYAFAGCESITMFNSETEGELIIPEGVTTIGSYAFQGLSSITNIVVPDTVTTIGVGAFKGCDALEEITLPFVGKSSSSNGTNEAVFGHIFGRYTSSAYSKPEGTTYQSWGNGYSSSIGTSGYNYSYSTYYYADYYYIPTSIKRVTITSDTTIPYGAFHNCDFIEEIEIPTTVSSTGNYAYYNCSATVSETYDPKTDISWNGSTVADDFSGGSGTEDDPYVISTGAELALLAQMVNGGENFDGVYFELARNISLNGNALTPIGSKTNKFAGTFNGNGFVISNFSITTSRQYVGLFGYVTGTIENLGVQGTINVSGTTTNSYAGLVAGYSTGTIQNCYAIGTVSLSSSNTTYAGGLVGYSEGDITDCYSNVSVNSISSGYMAYAGGLIGYVKSGAVSGSYATGNVKAQGTSIEYSRNGGLVGYINSSAEITDCYRFENQQLTRYTTVGSAYCEEGASASLETIKSYVSENWSSDVWSFKNTHPKFAKN